MIIRESIYAALWALGAGAARFASANRRLRHWTDLAAAEQPALFMSEKGAHAATKALGTPIVWTLYADFYSTSTRATLTWLRLPSSTRFSIRLKLYWRRRRR